MLATRFRRVVRAIALALAFCLTAETGALPALAAPAPAPAREAGSFVADVMQREFGRIGAKTEAFLKELEALGASGADPELKKLLEDPSVTALSADVTEEFARFLEKEYPDIWKKFFQKAPDMLGIEVDVVVQVLKSGDVKDAGGLRDKLKQAALFFKGDKDKLLKLFGDNQFRSLVKLTGQPVLHDVAKNSLVGAFVGCGIETGLNLLLGKPIDVKELAANVALDFTRAFLADAVKRTVTKALLTKLATTNKVLYTAVGRFGMVSGTFVSAIVGMVGEELLDWILKGDATGLRKLADHPEVLLERGAQCVAGQLFGEAFSWAFAAIGSVFGPIGTAVGKALGFVVGYAIGYCIIGNYLEKRRQRNARDFVMKGRYFKARGERAAKVLAIIPGAGWQTLATLEELADGDYKKLVKALGGHPTDLEVTVAKDGDPEEARPLKAKLAAAADRLGIGGAFLGLLVKQQLEVDEASSYLRAFEADYEEKLDRELKRLTDGVWEQALNAGPEIDGALDKLKGTPWYQKIKDAMEKTDLIDPELNLWSYDGTCDRLVKLGPAFVGDPKETVFVREKPYERYDASMDAWPEGQTREPRLRDYLAYYYVKTDDDHFPWHYNPLVDDWTPKYSLPTAAMGGVLGLDPDATVGEYGGATEEGLALLAEVKRIDDAARKAKVDPYADAEAMALTLVFAGDQAKGLPEDLRKLRAVLVASGLKSGGLVLPLFLQGLGDGKARDRVPKNLTSIRSTNAYLFDVLYGLVRPDVATAPFLAGPFGWEIALRNPEATAKALAANLGRLAAFRDFIAALGSRTMTCAKDLLVALDETPSAGFFRNGLDRALQGEFERLASPGLFGTLFGALDQVVATVGGNAGGRPVAARDMKPEKLGRYLMMANLREAVYEAPYKPVADTEKERQFLPTFEAALKAANGVLRGSAATADDPSTVREIDRKLKTNQVK